MYNYFYYLCKMINDKTSSVSIKTLGCKLNFSESATIEQKLAQKGFVIKTGYQAADCYIINSCAVTENSEKKCRQLIHRLKQINPQSKIIIIGCYGALKHSELLQNQVDMILGNNDKMQVVDYLEQIFHHNPQAIEKLPKDSFFSAYSLHERTRSFLKIQDGCDYHCTYCTVWKARGNSRSDSIENVVNNAKKIVANDIKEIILSGVNIGDFRTEKGENFYQLLQQLVQVEGLERIRISSIEPNLLTQEIIDLAGENHKILPHFHIPLQSGNNHILSLMRRKYQREFFADKIQQVKACLPHACIAADVIVGFPTETEADFEDTYQFLDSIPVNMLHIFPYSQRPDTIAANMEGQISQGVKNQRVKKLIALSDKKKLAFYQENQGKTYPVLVEHKKENGFLYGFTPNYIKVKFPYQSHIANQIINVTLSQLDSNNIYITK